MEAGCHLMMDTTSSGRARPHGPDAYPPAPVELDPVLRDVFDAAPMLIWMSGPDKLCTWFNRPWLDFTGRTMQQELGNGWAEGVHADDLDRCLDIYNRHFDEQRPFRMQYRLRADDSTYRWIDDSGIPRYGPDGAFLGYIGACTDIHDVRKAEAELLALRQELKESIERAETPLQPEAREPHPLPELVARELNAILFTVLGNLEAAHQHIASDRPREAQLNRAIDDALRAARRAPTLLERLLSFVQRYDQP
jgi:PAS domain S-box-containing protein